MEHSRLKDTVFVVGPRADILRRFGGQQSLVGNESDGALRDDSSNDHHPQSRGSYELTEEDAASMCDCFKKDRESFTRTWFADSGLCETCQELDVMHYFLKHIRGLQLLGLGSVTEVSERRTCPFCRLVYQLLPLDMRRLDAPVGSPEEMVELMPM